MEPGNGVLWRWINDFRIPVNIYKVIARARKQEIEPRKSTNKRFLQTEYGMKRLEKVEISLENQKKLAVRCYNKSYPMNWFNLIPNA